jgi:hypothetical protein
MPISGQCPGCKATLKLSDTFSGKKVRCIKCGKDFMINAGGGDEGKKTNPAIHIGPGSSGKMPKHEAPGSGKIPKPEGGTASGKMPRPEGGTASGKMPKPESGVSSGKMTKPSINLAGSQSGKMPRPSIDIEPDKGSSGGAVLLLLGGLAVVFMCVLVPLGGAIGWYFLADSTPEGPSVAVLPKDKEPIIPDKDKFLNPNQDKTPTPDKDKQPGQDKDKTLPPPPPDKDRKDKDKQPPPKDKQPPPPKDKQPPPPKDKQPKDKQPPPPKDKQPPPPKDKQPPPPKDKQPQPPKPEPESEPKSEPLPVARYKYTDEELVQIMEDLKAEDPAKKLDAADRLANAEPNDKRRGDVSRLLEPLLDPKEMNEALRRSGTRALGVWADAQSVPILKERMGPDEKDILVKALAVAVIGHIKEGNAADLVAAALADLLLRHYAAQSLRAMGPGAEKAVLKMLEHPDAAVRAEACKILADIGTKASVPALEMVAKDPNPRIANAASEALKALSGKS